MELNGFMIGPEIKTLFKIKVRALIAEHPVLQSRWSASLHSDRIKIQDLFAMYRVKMKLFLCPRLSIDAFYMPKYMPQPGHQEFIGILESTQHKLQ